MTYAKLTPRRKSTTVEVEVDIDDLIDAGWHHEDDCPERRSIIADDNEKLTQAVGSLHRQAHPSQNSDPFMCREEPCRSLPGSALIPTMSSR